MIDRCLFFQKFSERELYQNVLKQDDLKLFKLKVFI